MLKSTCSVKHFLGLLVGAMVAVGGFHVSEALAQGGPSLVRVGEVKLEKVQERRLVVGALQATRRSQVAAEEEGRIVHAPPDAGTWVKQGQLLAQVDATLLELEKMTMLAMQNQAQAVVSQREADLKRIQRELESITALTQRGAANDKERDDAADDVTAAEAMLAQAKAALAVQKQSIAELNERLERMQVLAPFDGYVVAKDTELGQWVTPGDPIVSLIQTAPIDAVFDAPEYLVDKLEKGMVVDLTVQGLSLVTEGVVDRIVPDVDPISRTFPVAVRMDNENQRLRPGMTVEAMAPTSAQIQATTVPRDAVLVTASGAQVVVNRDGVAQILPVVIRFGLPDRFVVQGDLKAGDQVVIEGNERLYPGTPLQVLPPQVSQALESSAGESKI